MGKGTNARNAARARKTLHNWLKSKGFNFDHCPSSREIRDAVINHPEAEPELKHLLSTSTNKSWKLAAIKYFGLFDPDLTEWKSKKSHRAKQPKIKRAENTTRKKMSFTKDPTKQNLKPVWKNFYSSDEWRALRYAAFAAYGRKCGCCGASPETGAVMHVDHIKPRFTHPELALELSNLQILCADCNQGKGAWDSTDWRWKAEEERIDKAFKSTV